MVQMKVEVLENRQRRLHELRVKYFDMREANEDPVRGILIQSKIDETDIGLAAIKEMITRILREPPYHELKNQPFPPLKAALLEPPALPPPKHVARKRRKKAPKKKDEMLFQP